jgi:ribulose-phosphate 3-epimerase
MDHHFVPNLTFGPLIVAAVRKLTEAFVDVHLMVEYPERLVGGFRDAGADQITVHLEACKEPGAVLDQVRATGARAGLALKPATPFAAAEPFLDRLDLLLVMTVEPGFGGQAFMEETLGKVRDARAWRERDPGGAAYLIEVDGGIGPETGRRARAAGAEVFVAGHAVFRASDPRSALDSLRRTIV